VARNQATGAEARTISGKNGAYRFTGLEPGEYTVEAESPRLGHGQVEDIVVNVGQVARVQTAIEFAPFAATPVQPAEQAAKHPDLNPSQLNEADLAQLQSPRHDLEPTELLVSGIAWAAAPLHLLSMSERPVGGAGENSATTAPEVKATLAAAPLQSPSSPAGPEKAAGRAEQAGGGAASSNSGETAAKAAGQIVLPPQSPVLATSQRSGPVSAAVTTTMSASELQALPVSGRNWQDFVLSNAPTSVTPEGGQGQTSMQGADRQPAGIAVDGVNSGLAFGRTGGLGQGRADPAGMAQVGMGGHGLALSEAAIREVQTLSGNAEASADRAAGGGMNVETRSGTNELHGQGFLFDRQNNWGAQNPFSQWVKETAPATESTAPVFTPESYTPPDHETTWGIGMGGPILRDKLFWFAALDAHYHNDPGVSMVRHPYLCANPPECTEITGFFAQPSNDQMQVLSARLGLGSANPVAEGLAQYSAMLETLGGLLGPAPRTATQWSGFGRIDWKASERQSFTLEGTGARWNSPGGGLTRVSETYGNHSFGSTKASEEWLLGRWERFLTPNLLAVSQFSARDNLREARPETPSAFEQSFLAGNEWGQLPQIVVDNRYGFTIGNPSRFGQGSYPDEHLYQGRESVDWAHGNLLVRTGFEVNHDSDETSLLRNQTGTYTYSSVENFISDALVFGKFGLSNALNPDNQHNCDETGTVWRDSGGNLRGLGNLPCYSYYSQTIGPAGWHLSTNDWAGYASAQWQTSKLMVVSAGLRWEQEQLPPPLAALKNPELPLTGNLPSLGNEWGPRISLAVGSGEGHWPVLRLGYGMYFGRTNNRDVETALTQTGSLNGDLRLFMRPTDDLPNNGGGAPPFPYVPRPPGPGSVVKPGAVEFAPNFHNPEVHQAVAAVEEALSSRVTVTASAMLSLGRRLPVSVDTNFGPAVNPKTITYAVVDGTGKGPIKATQITVPFYASWPSSDCSSGSQLNSGGQCGWLNPDYQQIDEIMSRANSTYEAGMMRVDLRGRRGLSLQARYVYSHSTDWNPNESVLDPSNFGLEHGTSNLDMRHAVTSMVIYEVPWKLRNLAGKLGNGWILSGIGQFHSGLPYTMRTSGSLAKEFDTSGDVIAGLGPGINGSGGDNRVYGVGNDNRVYDIGRNSYRYPATWKADVRLARRFNLSQRLRLEVLAESFNLFNHQNVTELETTGYTIESGSPPSTQGAPGTLPTLNFLTGPVVETNGTTQKANSTAFGQPLNINATNFYRERQIQFGLRLSF
jgi:hypothetical protein